MNKLGPIQKKIMLVLLGGVALGLSGNSRQYFRTFRKICWEWKKIDQRNFNRSVKRLAREKLVEEKIMPDGSLELVLTEQGRKEARILKFLAKPIKLKKPKRWDGKWRLVIFDIPEKDRAFRDILREHLRTLKFYKLQHSVFISPYPFEKQILELSMIYSATSYVRVITAIRIDNEDKIKRHFFK